MNSIIIIIIIISSSYWPAVVWRTVEVQVRELRRPLVLVARHASCEAAADPGTQLSINTD